MCCKWSLNFFPCFFPDVFVSKKPQQWQENRLQKFLALLADPHQRAHWDFHEPNLELSTSPGGELQILKLTLFRGTTFWGVNFGVKKHSSLRSEKRPKKTWPKHTSGGDPHGLGVTRGAERVCQTPLPLPL